jgi:hypothetical protein
MFHSFVVFDFFARLLVQFNRTVSQFSGLNFDLNLASLNAYYGNHICGDNTESIALETYFDSHGRSYYINYADHAF